MKNPVIILALYFLSIVAILFSMMGGGSSDKVADTTGAADLQKANSTEVDLSDAPAIEPSTLTTALVTGDSADETADKENNDSDSASKDESSSAETNPEVADATITAEGTENQTTEASSTTTTTTTTSEAISDAIPAAGDTETQFSEMSADELLLMAREAYWNNGLDESAQIYQQLIELNPETVDYKGELGNVYWRQGFPKKAAELYAEISLPMIEEGNADKVANMVGFIGLFFPEKATEIHNILQAAK